MASPLKSQFNADDETQPARWYAYSEYSSSFLRIDNGQGTGCRQHGADNVFARVDRVQ
jgi:hypothetical protein